jgi:hypothetical protein
MARLTPATAPPGTPVLVPGRPHEPAVLGVLVGRPHSRERYVDLGGFAPKRIPVSRLRLADGPDESEATSPAGWRAP